MTNLTLIIISSLIIGYALLDYLLPRMRKGKSTLVINLKHRLKTDALIFIALLAVIIVQSYHSLSALSVFLLGMLIALGLYLAFFRISKIFFKADGFFYDTIFVDYRKISKVMVSEDNKVVILLSNGAQLIFVPQQPTDIDKIVAFFGGYSTPSSAS